METISASKLRKEVYDYLAANGFQMDDKVKNGLSSILKSVLEHRVIESRKENDAPIKHEITCPKCQGVTLRSGKSFKSYRKRIKQSGGTVN